MLDLSKHKVRFFFLVFFILFAGTALAVVFASGYRIDFSTLSLRPTGILVATSKPDGAEVFINKKLKTATNNTLTLSPGKYLVEIKKESFSPWQKNIIITKELVTKVDAFLFPTVPDIKPITFSNVQNPILSPDGTKILYLVTVPDTQPGVWIADLTDYIFNIGREPKQIATSSALLDFSKAEISWTFDSRQVLTDFGKNQPKYLLDPSAFNKQTVLVNINTSLPTIILNLQKEEDLKIESKMKRLPLEMQKILKESTKNINFSPDNTKVSYIATASAQITDKLIPEVMAASTQKQERNLESNKLYVYNIKEDRNYSIPSSQIATTKWFPTSEHLFWIDKDKVIACEYDGTNLTTIYSGPFIPPFVFAAPGANKLIILSKLNLDKNSRPNLFSVSLR